MSVVLRAAIECAFLLLQYRLFGFRVPELYKCRVSPPPKFKSQRGISLGRSLPKHSGLLLLQADGKDDLYPFHVRHHLIVHVFKLHGADISGLALDSEAPSKTKGQAATCQASGQCSNSCFRLMTPLKLARKLEDSLV